MAAIAVTGGAAALTGTEPDIAAGATHELDLSAQRGGAVPSPVAAVVPAPVVPVQAALDAPVLDTSVLSDAVTRAQDEARRLADDARAREAQARGRRRAGGTGREGGRAAPTRRPRVRRAGGG